MVEAVTEKIPLDNLFRLAKEGGGKGVKAAVIELLKQMGTEATEEMISEIANNVVDLAVMGDSSEYQMYVQELQAAGLSREEAERQAGGRQTAGPVVRRRANDGPGSIYTVDVPGDVIGLRPTTVPAVFDCLAPRWAAER